MNQNLFRQFVYVQTSSFFNWVSIRGYAIHEAGPFTEKDQHSRGVSGAIEFKVGHPWDKTAFITGWAARDEQFDPVPREFYTTTTYAGIEHRFSERFQIRAVGEYVRAWRVDQQRFAIAQAARPSGTFQFNPTRNWSMEGSVAYARNMGIHFYDAVQSSFAVSYALPVQRSFNENGVELPLRYPIRFSSGVQTENFYNFPGSGTNQIKPFISINIF
jgi:hypothetical protein